MVALIGWELKKLFSRRFVVWLILALGFALWTFVNWSTVDIYGLSGYAQGMKDVYRQYEGQTITEEFQAQMQQDFDGYVAAHADQYELHILAEGEPEERAEYMAKEWGYDTGVWQVYNDLMQGPSLEDEQRFVRDAVERVATGTNEVGDPLLPYQLRSYKDRVRMGVQTPVIHYTKGWSESSYESLLPGMLTLICMGLTLLGLFNGEGASRTEPIVLTTKDRKRVAWAKLWAGSLVTLVVAVLFYGLQFAVMAAVWGLDGAGLPFDALSHYAGGSPMTIGGAYGLSLVALLAMAVACSAVVAWGSARFRHPLVTLLAAGAILGGMVLIQDTWGQNYWRFMNYEWSDYLYSALGLLPSVALVIPGPLPYRMSHLPWPVLELALPLVLTALLWWHSIHHFLRRRKV